MTRRAPGLPAGFGAKLKALIRSGHPPREAMKLAWRGLGRIVNPAPRRPSRAMFCAERVAAPARFAAGSFRTVKVGAHRITVGCPRGHFHGGRCAVGTQTQRILHPAGERGTCPVPGRELENRATSRAQLDAGTVNLEASDEVSALVIGAGGIKPSPGLRGEFRDVPMRFKRKRGRPLDELAQEIAEAQGRDAKDVQDKILEALKRRGRMFGEQARASRSGPPAGVDVPREDWRRMTDAERVATVEFFRAGSAAPGAGAVHRPRVRVEADRFLLGLRSPWKGRVSTVNAPASERRCTRCGTPTIYTSGLCRYCQDEAKKKNVPAMNPPLKAIVEDIYEGKSQVPTVRHIFYGATAARARAVRRAHARSDRFFAAAIRGASYLGIPLTARIVAQPNPLTRAEAGRLIKAARTAGQLGRRRRPPALTAPELRDPAAVAAARAYDLGRHDAYLGVDRAFGPARRRRKPARGRPQYRALGFRRALRNPPQGAVEIYGRVLEIKGQKGRRSRYAGQRFAHRFTHGGPILGLPGGQLLVAGGR